jgi:hypothetical protein
MVSRSKRIMDILAIIAERKIREAMARGELDDLSGKGKPLARDEDLSWVPEELRIAYKVLKNVGFVPTEVELSKEIVSLREMLMQLEDDEQPSAVRPENKGRI